MKNLTARENYGLVIEGLKFVLFLVELFKSSPKLTRWSICASEDIIQPFIYEESLIQNQETCQAQHCL